MNKTHCDSCDKTPASSSIEKVVSLINRGLFKDVRVTIQLASRYDAPDPVDLCDDCKQAILSKLFQAFGGVFGGANL